MALSYVDTSALAKWYLPETGSDSFTRWILQQSEACISSLTITEFRCLLARRQRMQYLTAVQVQEVYANFKQDIQSGHLLQNAVHDQQILNAELMIESLPTIPLRSLDALHLSIAHDLTVETIATADQVMRDAAHHLGFDIAWFGG